MITVRATATGRIHLLKDMDCQDTIDFRLMDGGFVFAVADGAGSAASPREGSQVASGAFCDYLSKADLVYPYDGCLVAACGEARTALEAAAEKRGCALENLNTTLFGGVYSNGSLRCAGIGDSLGFVVGGNGSIQSPIKPAKGEFVNETVFVNSHRWRDFMQISPLMENPKYLFACSDGLLNIIYSLVLEDGAWRVIPHIDIMSGMVDYLVKSRRVADVDKELAEMLGSDKANNLNADDKALLVVVFHES